MPASHTIDIASAPRLRFLKWGLSGIATLAIAFAIRYLLIQPQEVGAICGAGHVPAWCGVREVIIDFHRFMIWGWLGLAGGVFAVLFGWRWAIWLGFTMSLMGLVLYNANYAAIGLLLTLLTLPRN